jgi:hypothetical protein
MNATNVLSKVYECFFDTVEKGKGRPTEILMGMKHFKNIVMKLEDNRRFTVSDRSYGIGWKKVNLITNDGEISIVALRDMPSDWMWIADWNGLKIFSDGNIERIKSPDGLEYTTERKTTGHVHICDHRYYADLSVFRPSTQGIIHGITYA